MKYTFDFLRYAVDGRQVKKLLLLIQTVVLLMLVGCRAQLGADIERFEAERAELIGTHAAELAELKTQAEAGIYITGYLPEDTDGDAWTLGQWLGCLERTYPGLSAEAKALACWCIFNRIDSPEYPDSMSWVLLQEGQFEEYDEAGEVTDQNYSIAANQLSRWLNGGTRPCGSGAVYITVSSEGVELRDSWETGRYTNYWRA